MIQGYELIGSYIYYRFFGVLMMKKTILFLVFFCTTLLASETFKLSVSLPNLIKLEHVYGGSGHVYFLKDQLTHKKYVFKANANLLQMKEEIVANALYQALQVNIPNFTVLKTIPPCLSEEPLPHSPLYLLSEFIEGQQMGKLQGEAYVEAIKLIAQDFVADAFLSNWDIIKTGAFDLKPSKNIIVSNNGQPVRVDNGGSLRFRAKGGLKRFVKNWDPFRVVELEAMRNPRLNPDGARIYGALPTNRILEQIHVILSKESALKNALDEVALAIELDREDYKELQQILNGRLKNLALIAHLETSNLALADAPATPATGAGIIIYSIHDKHPFILLGKRAGNDPTRHNGTWSNLGGMSECHQATLDHTLLDTALREVREESNALFNFSASELQASFSFDLIPNPLITDFRHDAVINKILYRSYLHKSDYVDAKLLLDAQKSAESSGQEYTDFKWIALHDIMAALQRKDGMVILENETLKLYPPLLHTLLFPTVRDALNTLASGGSPQAGNFQGLFGSQQAIISKPDIARISRLSPKEAMALQVVRHAAVQRQIKSRSLPATGSHFMLPNNNSSSNAHALANLPNTQTEGYLKAVLPNYEDALPELDVGQARAIHFRNIIKFLESPELNDPLVLESFNDAKKYHPKEFQAFVTMLVDAMISERENRSKVVFYHATSAEIGLLFDFLSEIRNTLAINGHEQVYLRALDSIFSEYPAIKDFIAEFTVDGITNNYIANYQDAGLAVNPFLFSNGVRPTSCSYWYLWKGFSNWPQISTVFKTLKKRLGIRGSYTEFDKIYQKYFFDNDRYHSRLLQIFVEPHWVDKISYSSLNRGHLLEIPIVQDKPAYHGTFEIMRLIRTQPRYLMELLPKTRFNGDGSESVVDIKTLQARIFMKPKYFYEPTITQILSYSRSNDEETIKNARVEINKFAKDELTSMLISNFNIDKDIGRENNKLGRLYHLLNLNKLDNPSPRAKNLIDFIEDGDIEGLSSWLHTHGQFDISEPLVNRHNGYRQPGYSPVEIAMRSRKFEVADALLAHQTGKDTREKRYFSKNFFEINFGMLPMAGFYLENFDIIEKLKYLNRQLFLETLENPSPRMALEKFIKNYRDRFSLNPIYAETIGIARMSESARTRYKILLSSLKPLDVFDVILTYAQQLPESIQTAINEHSELSTKKLLLRDYYQANFMHLKPILAYGMYPTRAKYCEDKLFSAERKLLHEQIISHYLGKQQDKLPHGTNTPKLLHSAGAPGAGKSAIIKRLSELGVFDLKEFVIIDPDEIRAMLPEYHIWQDRIENDGTISKSRIAELSQAEALYIGAQIFARAQKAGKNIFRDGTMKDLIFFSRFLAQVKQTTPAYETMIVHIDVDEQVAWSRIQSRGKIEGRLVGREFFERAAPHIINSTMEHLKRLSNFYVKIDNNDEPKITQYLINENANKNAALFSAALVDLEQADYQTVLSILEVLDKPTQELTIEQLSLREFPSTNF